MTVIVSVTVLPGPNIATIVCAIIAAMSMFQSMLNNTIFPVHIFDGCIIAPVSFTCAANWKSEIRNIRKREDESRMIREKGFGGKHACTAGNVTFPSCTLMFTKHGQLFFGV